MYRVGVDGSGCVRFGRGVRFRQRGVIEMGNRESARYTKSFVSARARVYVKKSRWRVFVRINAS